MKDLIAKHEKFVESWKPEWSSVGAEPKKKLAILTDMDARIDPFRIFDLEIGDAVIIRNAGAVMTDDVIRSLTLAVHKLGVEKILVMGSNKNPLEKLDYEKLDMKIRETIDKDVEDVIGEPIAPWLKVFEDVEDNLIQQMVFLKRNPLLKGVDVRGVLYDVESGQVEFVE